MHVKTGDTVVVISGNRAKDKSNKGKILKVLPKQNRVIVEGINMRKKHMKPTQQMQQAGIIDIEGSIDASNVLLYCEKCGKGVRTGHKVLENGKKVRYCKKCGETFDE
ncbi:MAG: 50S ribosomal protein L24 [Eubacteriaceae bacterium]|nr:50S ribosomal protein L24 [Eubacteriaceae bacterium]MBQ1466075.1 50S ribosomal protein L24 [Eubacteriaceae bacterium]MBR2780617.1 50S ribosomal protein L24 [Eubacteriaceae bacterium]